jgi:cytidine deaminase
LFSVNIFKKGRLSEGEIHAWLVALRPHAYIPESGFAVSVIMRARAGGEEDYYFGGVNVENTDHRLATHGEEGAISAMITGLGKQAEIVEVWVMGAPLSVKPGDKNPAAEACVSCCGKCRQQIVSLAAEDAKVHYVSLNGTSTTTTVGAFLPDAFTPRRFMPEFVKTSKAGAVSAAADIEKKLLRKGPLALPEIETWLKSLEPVDFITKVSQSLVVELDNGSYIAGTRAEDPAFIDISAAQSAMAVASALFGACTVKNAWVYISGDDEKKLLLSALQVLFEFAQDEKLPVHYI